MPSSQKVNQPLEKGRISAFQFGLLGITMVISTADVFLPAYVAQEAQQDSWLSVLFGTASSLIISILFILLAKKFPGKTLVEYSVELLGKVAGKLVASLFILYMLVLGYSVIRQLGDIFVTSFNPDGPLIIYSVITTLVAAYAVHNGLEVIVRVNQLILPFGLGILGFISLVNITETDLTNYLPILENGIVPPLKGAVLIQAWLLELVILLQFVPFVQDKKNIGKSFTLTNLVLGFSMLLGTLTIAVFGKLTSQLIYPALEYVRYATIGEYVKNLDITIMGVWIIGLFIKVTILYYGVVLGISQLFGFKSYKPMIVPVGLLFITLSVSASERVITVFNFGHFTFPFLSFFMAFFLPLLLFLVSLVRRKKS